MTVYGAEELASAAGVSVAALRSYQSKGLLPPPRRDGRRAVYGDHHLERLRRIASLKSHGHSLRSIAERLDGVVDDPAWEERLRLRDVAERSGMPVEMLRSLIASGLLAGRRDDDGPYYTDADVRAVSCVLLLVGSGIPFDRFIDVAEPQLRAGADVATGSLELFDRFVASRLSTVAEQQTALRSMAAAIGTLAGYLVERQVLAGRAE